MGWTALLNRLFLSSYRSGQPPSEANTKLKDGVTVLRAIWVRSLEKATCFDVISEHIARGDPQMMITYDVWTGDLDRVRNDEAWSAVMQIVIYGILRRTIRLDCKYHFFRKSWNMCLSVDFTHFKICGGKLKPFPRHLPPSIIQSVMQVKVVRLSEAMSWFVGSLSK